MRESAGNKCEINDDIDWESVLGVRRCCGGDCREEDVRSRQLLLFLLFMRGEDDVEADDGVEAGARRPLRMIGGLSDRSNADIDLGET